MIAPKEKVEKFAKISSISYDGLVEGNKMASRINVGG